MKQLKKQFKVLPIKTGFKFWELGKLFIGKNSKINANIGKMIIEGIDKAYVPTEDTPRMSYDGFYCPKILGYCHAYLPKRKPSREVLRAS